MQTFDARRNGGADIQIAIQHDVQIETRPKKVFVQSDSAATRPNATFVYPPELDFDDAARARVHALDAVLERIGEEQSVESGWVLDVGEVRS